MQWLIDTVTIFNGTRDTVVDGANVVKPSGPGSYQSIAPPLEPATLTVAVVAALGGVDTTISRFIPPPVNQVVTFQTTQYRHVGYKSIVLTQRVTRIQLRCPDTHACDSLAVGDVWSVWVDGFDALNRQIYSLFGAATNPLTGNPVATFAVRDSTVARVAPLGIRATAVTAVTALTSGSTWIVATRGALLDSLRLVVR